MSENDPFIWAENLGHTLVWLKNSVTEPASFQKYSQDPPKIQCGVAKVVLEPIIVSVVQWVPCN